MSSPSHPVRASHQGCSAGYPLVFFMLGGDTHILPIKGLRVQELDLLDVFHLSGQEEGSDRCSCQGDGHPALRMDMPKPGGLGSKPSSC
eukprot:1145425-Pelagomonas_calceolata.AAC.4